MFGTVYIMLEESKTVTTLGPERAYVGGVDAFKVRQTDKTYKVPGFKLFGLWFGPNIVIDKKGNPRGLLSFLIKEVKEGDFNGYFDNLVREGL